MKALVSRISLWTDSKDQKEVMFELPSSHTHHILSSDGERLVSFGKTLLMDILLKMPYLNMLCVICKTQTLRTAVLCCVEKLDICVGPAPDSCSDVETHGETLVVCTLRDQ